MIGKAFKQRKAFIGYMTTGSEEQEYQVEAALALHRGGVDILELGLPYSDPVADGPVIQSAMQRALQRNTRHSAFLKLVRRIRESVQMPIVLFSYANPLLQLGESFLKDAYEAGVNGMLVVDLPLEEGERIKSSLQRIQLVTPSTSDTRIPVISDKGEGFLYYVCQKGTTGMRNATPVDLEEQIQRIKKYSKHPVAVGFGISSKEGAREVLQHADGFVIGSAFVKAMSEGISPENLEAYTRTLDPRL